jgi:hypothetical protein
VAPNPGERQRQLVLVAAPPSAVEQLVGAVERLQAAGVAGVGVVDEAVLQRERAQTGVLHVVGNRNLEVIVEVRS